MVQRRTWLAGWWLGVGLAAVGCTPEPIVSYKVEKLTPDVGDAAPDRGSSSAPGAVAKETRILAAIARLPEITWTIKVTGDPQAIASIEPQWEPFLRSLKFAGESAPTFELPAGWRNTGRTAQFRDVILDIESVAPALEVIFTRMPPEFDLIANVNRWRAGQLGLNPIGAAELPNHLRELAVGDQKLLLFDATGTPRGDGGMGSMLPANSPPQATDTGAAAEDSRPSESSTESNALPTPPITFDPPAGWESGLTNPIVAGKFTKTDEGRSVELSVVALKADSPWEQTVAIWSEGLGLSEMTAEELAARTESIQLADQPARLIQLSSLDGKRLTRVASLIQGDTNWVIKLTGDAGLVAAEKATWDQFLQSIRLTSPAPSN